MKQYEYKTVTRLLLADMHTPVSLYLKIRDVYPESALLESSDYHGVEDSHSFVGIAPLATITIKNELATLSFPDGKEEKMEINDGISVADAMNRFLNSFSVEGEEKEFAGLFGYTSFDAVRYFEAIPIKLDEESDDEIPEMRYTLFKYTLVFNHFKNQMTLIELLHEDENCSLNNIETIIGNRNYASYDFARAGEESSTISGEEYKAMVRKGIAHCLRGDVFQIVLSRRFEQAFKGDDFKVYRALRSINPSPYLFYFDFGSFRIFGSSPETHCKIEDGKAYIDPIAGTAFRSGNAKIDAERTEELVNNPKENAEHVMLVDLARNDLSRNARNVHVEFYKEVQQFSHVIHLVSRVSGTINEDSDSISSYIDTFPAGTLSGAPKVRAMQLISEMEKQKRGIYGGCIGFIGLNAMLNQAIIIRSFVSKNNVLYYQAGAGIVSKSEEERELEEVSRKLGALKKSIEIAEKLKN